MERSRQLFCSRNFILSALQYNTIQILLSTPHGGFSETSINSTGNQKKNTSRLHQHVLEYKQIFKFVLKSKLGEVAVRLKPKAKESSEPMFIENNNKTSKGREGWELQNFQTVELLQLSSTAQNETQDFY